MISLKNTAASTPWRRTGCSVISLASAGSRQASSIVPVCRSARYSGSDRPACRMNQTGVTSGRSPRSARTRREFAVPWATSGWEGVAGRMMSSRQRFAQVFDGG